MIARFACPKPNLGQSRPIPSQSQQTLAITSIMPITASQASLVNPKPIPSQSETDAGQSQANPSKNLDNHSHGTHGPIPALQALPRQSRLITANPGPIPIKASAITGITGESRHKPQLSQQSWFFGPPGPLAPRLLAAQPRFCRIECQSWVSSVQEPSGSSFSCSRSLKRPCSC